MNITKFLKKKEGEGIRGEKREDNIQVLDWKCKFLDVSNLTSDHFSMVC